MTNWSAALDKPSELSAAGRRDLRRLCAFQAYVLNSLTNSLGLRPAHRNPNMHMMAMAARRTPRTWSRIIPSSSRGPMDLELHA